MAEGHGAHGTRLDLIQLKPLPSARIPAGQIWAPAALLHRESPLCHLTGACWGGLTGVPVLGSAVQALPPTPLMPV